MHPKMNAKNALAVFPQFFMRPMRVNLEFTPCQEPIAFVFDFSDYEREMRGYSPEARSQK
jgi:hypothetical protein